MTQFDMHTGPLNGAQKAAIIVKLLSAEGGAIPLSSLTSEAQHRLVTQFQKLGRVDKFLVDQVVDEFSAQVNDPSLRFPGDLDKTLNLIEANISPQVANDLRRGAGLAPKQDPWPEIAAIPVPALAAAVLQEGVQVGAIVVSKLTPEAASEVMAALPEDVAKTIAYAVQETEHVRPEVVDCIGVALHKLSQPLGPHAFATQPVVRVADILNAAVSSQRDAMLAALETIDEKFASEVRQAIFTFEDIGFRLETTDVAKFIRVVDGEVMVKALAAARATMPDTNDFILSNMSQRMADQFREEMSEIENISVKEGEKAMAQVTAAIRKLKEDGDIKFVTRSGEEDEAEAS
jgi:flagellar motor switch protein FliG